MDFHEKSHSMNRNAKFRYLFCTFKSINRRFTIYCTSIVFNFFLLNLFENMICWKRRRLIRLYKIFMLTNDAVFQLDQPPPMHGEPFWIAAIDNDSMKINKSGKLSRPSLGHSSHSPQPAIFRRPITHLIWRSFPSLGPVHFFPKLFSNIA